MPISMFQAATDQVPAQAPPPPPAVPPPDLADPAVAPHLDALDHLEHLPSAEAIEAQVNAALAAAGLQDAPFVFAGPPGIPEELIALVLGSLALLLLMIVGYPIARAIARRIDRQSASPMAASTEITARLERIEHAVETMAVEIERISEGQRFTTRLLSEQAQGARAGVGNGGG